MYILKKINVKNNYRKIGKKKDNDVDVDMTQLECSNNKCYTSALLRTNFPHNMASFHWRPALRQNYHGFWEKSILKPKRVHVHKNDVEPMVQNSWRYNLIKAHSSSSWHNIIIFGS